MGALEVWDLDDRAEAVYRALLRNPGLGTGQLAGHVGCAPAEVTEALAALTAVGLVAREGRRPVAASPAVALGTMLDRELAGLEGRRAQLDTLRAKLTSFTADHLLGQSRSWSTVPFEILSADESQAAMEDLQRSTSGEVLSCHAVRDMIATENYLDVVRRDLAAGRSMRAVYPTSVVDEARGLAYVREWSAAGEQVRLLPFHPREIDVFGDELALVSLEWQGITDGSMILVRTPSLVALVRELFERYWDRALPLRRAVGAPEDGQREILELLMLGAKDESIARQLGVSLRTVRRRVADLLDDLGVASRFQAGVEAARRGMI